MENWVYYFCLVDRFVDFSPSINHQLKSVLLLKLEYKLNASKKRYTTKDLFIGDE